jgi:hypothetical protein
MKSLNFRTNKGVSVILLFSLVLAACGGGSAASYSADKAGAASASAPPPAISLTAASNSIINNASTAITWSSTNSTSCTSPAGGGSGTTGTFNTGALTTPTTFTVTCVGAGGAASQSTTVTVASSAGPAAPSVSVSASSPSIAYNANTNINWSSTNSTSCTSPAGGGTGTTGSFNTGALSTTTTYAVTCVGAGGSANQSTTVTVAPQVVTPPPPTSTGCSATGGAITLSNVPSRTTGVAPLSVFFDATASTATTTTRSFHDLEYRWNFGENQAVLAALPGGTNWTNGSTKGSRNLANGPVAAHVFETPGVYTVALTATDGTNTGSSCAQITVQDPNTVFSGTNTICVSSNTNPTPGSGGCPVGAAHYQQADFGAAVNAYIGTGKRILFKRGDTFANASGPWISVTGPGIIGAYGAGAKPIIQATGNTPILTLSTPSTPTIKDWRIMDLYFDGLNGSSAHGVDAKGTMNQVTFLRMDMLHVLQGYRLNDSELQYNNGSGTPGHRIFDELAIVDSTVSNNNSYGAFVNAHYFSMMGVLITNAPATSTGTPTRFAQLVKAVISNNTLENATSTKELIKLHAPTNCDSSAGHTPGCNYTNDTFPLVNAISNDGIKTFGYSEQIQISDNKLVSGPLSDYMITAGTQNSNSDERTRNLIFERNWLVASSSTQMVIGVMSRNVTIRNNICDLTLRTAGGRCFNVGNWGIEPPPDNVQIYNNTVYSSSAGTVQGILLFPVTTNVTVKNNLGYTPAASGSIMVDGSSGSGYSASNNSTNTQMRSTDPQFTAPLTGPVGFRVATGSYAAGTGVVAVPVWSDFFSVSQTTTRDMGAVMH